MESNVQREMFDSTGRRENSIKENSGRHQVCEKQVKSKNEFGSTSEASRKRRHQKLQEVDGVLQHQVRSESPTKTKILKFKLFKFHGAKEDYILEEFKVEESLLTKWHLSLQEKGEYCTLKKCVVRKGELDVFQVEQDLYPAIFYQEYTDETFSQRLDDWTTTPSYRSTRKTPDNYYHHKEKTFRSLIEVCRFIIYSCKKELRCITAWAEDIAKTGAAEGLMLLSTAKWPCPEHDDGSEVMLQLDETVEALLLLMETPSACNQSFI